MKRTISALLAALLLALLAVSAAAVIPFPGTDLLRVTQDGKPVAGAQVDLYRTDRYGDNDTYLGTYTTDVDGMVTASHLTTGEYYWQDPSIVIEAPFRITGSGFVRTALELPVSVSKTVTFLGGEYTITADLSGGCLGELNSYGTLYLYSGLSADLQICNGFLEDQEEYEVHAADCRNAEIYKEEDGLIMSASTGEYGSVTYIFPVADGVYYRLVIDNTVDAESVLARVTVTPSAAAAD